MYVKDTGRLQERLDVYWIVHHFVRVHFTTRRVPAVALGWADENQRYGDKICIGERRNFCSRARSQLRGICYCVCVRFWVKYVQR